MEERTKEQTLGDLYALRAGLSLISQEVDEVTAIDRESDKTFSSLTNRAVGQHARFLLKRNLQDEGSAASVIDFVNDCTVKEDDVLFIEGQDENGDAGRKELAALTKLKDKNGVLSEGKEGAQQSSLQDKIHRTWERLGVSEGNTSRENSVGIREGTKQNSQKRKAQKTYLEWIGSPEGKAYYEKMKTQIPPNEEKKAKASKILTVIIVIAAVLVVVGFIGYLISYSTSGMTEYDDLTGTPLAFFLMWIISFMIMLGCAIGLAVVKKSVDQTKAKVAAATAVLGVADECAKMAKEADDARRNKLVPLMDVYSGVYSVLQKEYSSLLHERDWEYLDLVIFYLETGRADTMKEALQLVEREVQTQRIVDSVKQATYRIVDAIAQSAMVISTQLNYISRQLSNVLIMDNYPAIMTQQNELLYDEQSLKNALLSKAQTGSDQLVKDLYTMRAYRID